MWDRQKLHDLARTRKMALGGLNEALLAYARTREMTEEAGLDAGKVEQDLAATLDRLEPDDFQHMKALGSVERDEVLRDFMVVLADHNQQRIDRELKDVQAIDGPAREVPANEKAAPKRKRGLRLR